MRREKQTNGEWICLYKCRPTIDAWLESKDAYVTDIKCISTVLLGRVKLLFKQGLAKIDAKIDGSDKENSNHSRRHFTVSQKEQLNLYTIAVINGR